MDFVSIPHCSHTTCQKPAGRSGDTARIPLRPHGFFFGVKPAGIVLNLRGTTGTGGWRAEDSQNSARAREAGGEGTS